jgi:hypothetical protein
MNIVLIETSANQRYIFATNKLRENVGASEITYRIGTQFVLEAVAEETKSPIYEDGDLDGRKIRANLLDPSLNPPIENGNPVEVITATSGKALLLIKDKTFGEKIVRTVTARALREMPGLTVHGAISEGFNRLDEKDDKGEFKLHKAIGEVHRRLEEIRYQIPSNEQRFLRLPFVAPCKTSGLPAKTVVKERNDNILISALSKIKRENFDTGQQRLEAVVHAVNDSISLIRSVDELERRFKELSWVAVIHADGNGLGEIFQNFDRHTGLKDNNCSPREYIEKYRKFSLALDVCTINAAGNALKTLQQRFRNENKNNVGKAIPVVPLILGGDDLTVLCDGQYALKFVYEFLRQFESETEKIKEYEYLKKDSEGNPLLIDGKTVFEILTGVVPEIAGKAFGVPRLGICAGVAIVKAHFPFHQAYKLAEQLLKSAKDVKRRIKSKNKNEQYPCSALDYHILYDSTASRLEEIRDKMKSDNQATWLYARPYVVSEFSDATLEREIIELTWCKNRRWSELDDCVAAMMAKDDDNKRQLPNSQLHTLREALYLGKAETDARTRLVNHRYDDKGFGKLLWEPKTETLFFPENDEGKEHATHFLDALDIVEFRKGEKEENGELVDKKPTA